MREEIIGFEEITFRRDGKKILKGVNWTVHQGENWALLGLNGSGKSTLLGMIPAYTYPSSGEVRVFGHTYGKYEWQKVKARVGFVSSTMNEFSQTLNYQTVQRIVLSGKFSSIGLYDEVTEEDRFKADKIIEDFGINKIRESKYHLCSQGEQRRSLIARAFMNEPDLMVLDEPCSGLDLSAREELLKTLNDNYKKSHAPLIYVTHNIEEIIPAITHVAIMEDGQILRKGKKEEVLKDEILSEIYKQQVAVEWQYGRPWIKVSWDKG